MSIVECTETTVKEVQAERTYQRATNSSLLAREYGTLGMDVPYVRFIRGEVKLLGPAIADRPLHVANSDESRNVESDTASSS
jgi:hypothetical protein